MDDALNITTRFLLKHLENPMAYARLMFMDISSAFNTMLLHILVKKQKQMEVNPYIIKWYYAFLIQQQVKLNSILSDMQVISITAPQSCVSSTFFLHNTQMIVQTRIKIITLLDFQMTQPFSVY